MGHARDIRVSILIPNYNNGRQSSRDGRHDLLGDLLESLHRTLIDDPTPLEIIAYDDGSTDDSLDTLRQWSQKRWPDGRAFLELIEAEHCGVLAKTANILSRRAKGEILVRLDGDITCLTPNWASLLCGVFDHAPPRLGVVGPKQLRPDGCIHAFGDWVLHPHGYTHIAAGQPRHAVHHPMEVDHVMGCFYCCKKQVFDDLGGYDEDFLRGQTIDFGLRARLAGWSCMAVPHIEYVHRHGLRVARSTDADSAPGIRRSLQTFESKWGFCRLMPDLDAVCRLYAGTPLLWNARRFGLPDSPPADPTPEEPIKIESSDWGRYAKDEAFRQHVDLRVAVTLELIRQTGPAEKAVQVGCGSGLAAHLLALQGVSCTGIDRHQANVAFANQCTARQTYPQGSPCFMHQPDPRLLPLADGRADLLMLFGQLERHPNPIGLLREAHRVLATGKCVVILSARHNAISEPGPLDPLHRYTWAQLIAQIQAAGGWTLLIDPGHDRQAAEMIVVARRDAMPVARGSTSSEKSIARLARTGSPEPSTGLAPGVAPGTAPGPSIGDSPGS